MDALVSGADYQVTLQFDNPGSTHEGAAQNEANLRSAMRALTQGNEDEFWALFDPDVTFYEADELPYGGAHRGLEATRRAHASVHQYFDQLQAEVEQLMSAGDVVIALVTLTYRVRKNGRTGSFPLTEIYRFREGRIIEWRAIYFNAAAVVQAISAE